jgi:hypothetical protein
VSSVGRLGFDASAELMLLGWQNHHSAVIAFSVVGLASSRSIERLHVCFVFHTTTAGDCEDGKPRQEDGQVVQPDAPSGCQNYHDAPIAGTTWQVCYLHSSICDSLISNRLLQVSWTSGIVNKPRALRNFVHDLLEKSRNAQILEESMVTGMIM